jgi:hypothetical protein
MPVCFLREQQAVTQPEGQNSGNMRREIQAGQRRNPLVYLEAQFKPGQSVVQAAEKLAP